MLASLLRGISDEEKLKIFLSPELEAGTTWFDKIQKELKQPDIGVDPYLAESEPVKMVWCNYEAGFFAGISGLSADVTIEFGQRGPIQSIEDLFICANN
jgi:hypothetical protein